MRQNNDTDLQALWSKQTVPSANLQNIRQEIRCFRRRQIAFYLITGLLMLLTIGFALFIAFYFRPRLTSTYIGLALGGSAFLLALFSAGRSARLYHRLNDTCPNTKYLQALSSLRKQEYFHRHTMLTAYFVLLSLGLCLYMYEYTFARSWPTGIAVYVGLAGWITLNWFYFRPRILRKDKQRLEQFIGRNKELRQQL